MLACATGGDDGNDDAFVSTGTTNPSTTNPSSTDPVTTDPVSTDPVTTAVDESTDSSSGAIPDVPGECMPGELGCPCDMDGACVEPAVCEAEMCVDAIVCDADPNEPNDFDDDATPLGEISDNPADTLELAGVLDHADDVDWFSYHGTDVLGQTVAPTRTVIASGGTLEVCKFFTCDDGQAQVVCPGGTTAATEGGMNGCCAMGGFAFDDDGIECIAGAFNTGGTVYIRLQSGSAQCVDYSGTLTFG
jgi:hypothetical protein